EESTVPLLTERRLARTLRLRKRILRIERVGSHQREGAPLHVVGAGARDDADDRARRVAVLGAELARHDDVLADRFEREAAARAATFVVSASVASCATVSVRPERTSVAKPLSVARSS